VTHADPHECIRRDSAMFVVPLAKPPPIRDRPRLGRHLGQPRRAQRHQQPPHLLQVHPEQQVEREARNDAAKSQHVEIRNAGNIAELRLAHRCAQSGVTDGLVHRVAHGGDATAQILA